MALLTNFNIPELVTALFTNYSPKITLARLACLCFFKKGNHLHIAQLFLKVFMLVVSKKREMSNAIIERKNHCHFLPEPVPI